MPIYEYACTACGERTETKQSFADPPLTECLECGGSLRKLYSPVGVVFKGSGFYSTDAKKKPAGKSSESKSTKDGAKSDGSKTDKKTETKPEPSANKKAEKSA